MYDDLGLFHVFCFLDAVRSFSEEFDEFNDLQYLASTKGSSSALVGGWSCHYLRVFHCTSLEPFFQCLFLHFMVYSVETVNGAF